MAVDLHISVTVAIQGSEHNAEGPGPVTEQQLLSPATNDGLYHGLYSDLTSPQLECTLLPEASQDLLPQHEAANTRCVVCVLVPQVCGWFPSQATAVPIPVTWTLLYNY